MENTSYNPDFEISLTVGDCRPFKLGYWILLQNWLIPSPTMEIREIIQKTPDSRTSACPS